MSSEKPTFVRGLIATATQEKSEPKRLSGRRRRRKKNGWIRGMKNASEKIQGVAEILYCF
jgi:hypothetical protein